MSVEFDQITLPAFLACALINGDESGLEESDERVLNRVLDMLRSEGLEIIDVVRDADGNAEEPRFTWGYRMYMGDASGGDVLDYVTAKYTE